MENNIKVSIIIPAYNVENYIEDCLNSLINQTLKEIEIIVVNDGSTDSTPKIIEKFARKDSRIIVINQQNQGQASARNAGIEVAKGEFIGFVDSDDWIDSDYYEKLYNAALDNNAEMAVASIFKHKIKYNRYNVCYKKIKFAEKIKDKIKLCSDNKKRFFYVCNKLCKASIIKENDIMFPVGRVFEDVNFSMKVVFYAKKIVSVPNIKYHYIERMGSTVKSKKTEKKKNDHKLAYTELQEFAKMHNIKLPERLNYFTSYWKNPLVKVYKGLFIEKHLLFGFLPIFRRILNA